MSSSCEETPSTPTVEMAATCLMLLSKLDESHAQPSRDDVRAFECRTCGKRFTTFQALGGHRASHKKPKPDHDCFSQSKKTTAAPPRPKAHECAICGAEFALGQALGGHMRRHRDGASGGVLEIGSGDTTTFGAVHVKCKRVCLKMDLNLTPGENDLQTCVPDLKLQLGKRESEMRMESGTVQEYDLRLQMIKRRRFRDALLGLVAL
uniref:C2H2-type domain-containing protein n=1 Tax=Kalanchoe fedtschenkoi TaxID=63787 RepID=A0A7N0UIQ4_KALFE